MGHGWTQMNRELNCIYLCSSVPYPWQEFFLHGETGPNRLIAGWVGGCRISIRAEFRDKLALARG